MPQINELSWFYLSIKMIFSMLLIFISFNFMFNLNLNSKSKQFFYYFKILI